MARIMISLAAILISITLFRAAASGATITTAAPPGASKPYTSRALDLIGTDAVKDVIKYYNGRKHQGKIPSIVIPDLKDNYVIGKSSINITASKGRARSTADVVLVAPLKIEFVKSRIAEFETHSLTSIIPISISNLELIYRSLHVQANIGAPSSSFNRNKTHKKRGSHKTRGSVKVTVGKSILDLHAEVLHTNGTGTSNKCYARVGDIKIRQFEVTGVDIENLGAVEETVLDSLANEFRTKLLSKFYAAQVVRKLVEGALRRSLDYCKVVAKFTIKSVVRSS